MTSAAPQTLPHPGALPVLDGDARRHRRVELSLLGRMMMANKQEYPCRLSDISVGGAAIQSPVTPALGEHIIAYFDHIGGIEGHVVRTIDGGFAIELIATAHKREKLAAQLTWLINKDEFGAAPEQRSYQRNLVVSKSATLTLDEGISIKVDVLDISMSGASIATRARPPIDAEIKLGKLRGKVVRHHADGIAVQFLDIQQPEAVRKYFG